MNPNDIHPKPAAPQEPQAQYTSGNAAPTQPPSPMPPSQNPQSTQANYSQTMRPTAPRKHQALRDFMSIVAVLVSALTLAFGLISFVFQSYEVDGPSMQITLENKDHLIVWKIPRTVARITGNAYIPNRGDVVVFNDPSTGSYASSQDKQLIKRIVGLPNERVVIKNGKITIYNKEHPYPQHGFSPDESLPYGKDIPTTPGNIDVTLKEDQLFVVGDNRSNSLDSRVFGPIEANDVVGKLLLRILPINTFKTF